MRAAGLGERGQTANEAQTRRKERTARHRAVLVRRAQYAQLDEGSASLAKNSLIWLTIIGLAMPSNAASGPLTEPAGIVGQGGTCAIGGNIYDPIGVDDTAVQRELQMARRAALVHGDCDRASPPIGPRFGNVTVVHGCGPLDILEARSALQDRWVMQRIPDSLRTRGEVVATTQFHWRRIFPSCTLTSDERATYNWHAARRARTSILRQPCFNTLVWQHACHRGHYTGSAPACAQAPPG